MGWAMRRRDLSGNLDEIVRLQVVRGLREPHGSRGQTRRPKSKTATPTSVVISNYPTEFVWLCSPRFGSQWKSPPLGSERDSERWRIVPWPGVRQTPPTRRAKQSYKSLACSINCSSIFPGPNLAHWFRRHAAGRAAKGFTCWTPFVFMPFYQLGMPIPGPRFTTDWGVGRSALGLG